MLGVHVAPLREHVPSAILALAQIRDPRLAHDLGPADLRRLRVGVGHPIGIDVAFDRVVHGAEEMLLVHQRKQLRCLIDRDQFEIHAEIAAACLRHLEPVDSRGCAGEHDAAGDVHAARLTGNPLDLLVEIDRVLLQLGDVRIAVDRVHAAGGVPG